MSITPEQAAALISEPRKATGDSGSMERHSLKDMIEMDKYMADKAAVNSSSPIRHFKLVPPGTV
jgi:hypothetical protein